MDPVELERWVDSELKRLPDPPAPATLMPRVLEAVRAPRADVAAPRSWLTWPLTEQLASAVALVLVLAAAAGLWLVAREPLMAALSLPVTSVGGRVDEVHRQAYDLALAARVLWRVLEPFTVGLVAVVAIAVAACAAIGAALRTLVLGGTSA